MTFIALTPRGTGQLNSSVDQRWITGIRWRAFTVPTVKLNPLPTGVQWNRMEVHKTWQPISATQRTSDSENHGRT